MSVCSCAWVMYFAPFIPPPPCTTLTCTEGLQGEEITDKRIFIYMYECIQQIYMYIDTTDKYIETARAHIKGTWYRQKISHTRKCDYVCVFVHSRVCVHVYKCTQCDLGSRAWRACIMIDSTENATLPKSAKSRNLKTQIPRFECK